MHQKVTIFANFIFGKPNSLLLQRNKIITPMVLTFSRVDLRTTRLMWDCPVTSANASIRSVIYDPTNVVDSNSPLGSVTKLCLFLLDWYVQVALYHEYNLHTTDLGRRVNR